MKIFKNLIISFIILLLLPYDAQAKKCDFQEDFFTPVPAKKTGEWTVATQNMWRLFDDVKDGRAAVVSPKIYQMRLKKMSQQIRVVLNEPDILAVQEVESLKVLEDLAKQLKSDAAKVHYKSYLIPGNDMSGINVGFLVNDAIKVKSVSALLTSERLANSILFDRPPLMLTLFKNKRNHSAQINQNNT